MVNPLIFPEQKRGPSGPRGNTGGGPTDFLPSCNILYFDPNYGTSIENGAISNPFLTWAHWTAGAVGVGSTKVIFPGVPVAAGAQEIPIDDGYSLTIEGIRARENCSAITGSSEVAACSDADVQFESHHIYFESLGLNAGSYSVSFKDSVIAELQAIGAYVGPILGKDSVLTDCSSQDSDIEWIGGSIQSCNCKNLILTNTVVGTANLSGAGALLIEDTLIKCRGVTFAPGSTIAFAGSMGELWLDPISYRSFLDNSIVLTNGHVTRDDGSFPKDAAVYTGDTSGPVVIDFYANPRATINLSGEGNVDVNFILPLTREVELTSVQGVLNGRIINW